MTSEFELRVQQQANEIHDEETRNEFYAYQSDYYWLYSETFPMIFLNSFFVSTYSILETHLDLISEKLKKRKQQLIALSELKRGDYFESARQYILRLTSIDFCDKETRNKIKEYQQLRNIIVHENSKLENKSNGMRLAKKYKVYNESSKMISVSRSFADEFLSCLRRFFDDLYDKLGAGDHM